MYQKIIVLYKVKQKITGKIVVEKCFNNEYNFVQIKI
jgi:hypothetical protein